MDLFKFKAFKISVDPLFWVLPPVMLVSGYFTEYAAAFMSALLHETGHIVTALLVKRRINSVRILPVGLNAVIDDDMCPKWQNIIIYLGGPAANLLVCLLFLIKDAYAANSPENVHFFILINICIAVFNMIPVLPLDGGRLLNEILSGQIGLLLTGRYLRRISICLSVLLLTLGIVQFLGNSRNFSLLMVGIYVCFTIKFEERSVALMNMRNIFFRHSRVMKKGVYAARDLVAISSVNIGEVIKHMDFDRFHIIYVLDNALNLIKILTEQDIIDGMMKYGSEITFSEFIEKLSNKPAGNSQYNDGSLD